MDSFSCYASTKALVWPKSCRNCCRCSILLGLNGNLLKVCFAQSFCDSVPAYVFSKEHCHTHRSLWHVYSASCCSSCFVSFWTHVSYGIYCWHVLTFTNAKAIPLRPACSVSLCQIGCPSSMPGLVLPQANNSCSLIQHCIPGLGGKFVVPSGVCRSYVYDPLGNIFPDFVHIYTDGSVNRHLRTWTAAGYIPAFGVKMGGRLCFGTSIAKLNFVPLSWLWA